MYIEIPFIHSIAIVDGEGSRICAKYYTKMSEHEKQKFEKSLVDKVEEREIASSGGNEILEIFPLQFSTFFLF